MTYGKILEFSDYKSGIECEYDKKQLKRNKILTYFGLHQINVFDKGEGLTSGGVVRTIDDVSKQIHQALIKGTNIFAESDYLFNNLEGFTLGILEFGLDIYEKFINNEILMEIEETSLYFLIANGYFNEEQLETFSKNYDILTITRVYKNIDIEYFGNVLRKMHGENIEPMINYI